MNPPSGNPFKPGFGAQPEPASPTEVVKANPDAHPEAQEPNLNAGIIADKQLRVELDNQLQKLKALPASRERALSRTNLEQAIMWLGMDLKRLNDTRPYPSSYDPSNTKVEPTADGLKL